MPARTGEEFFLSPSCMIDFGRYLGSPDDVAGRGLRDADLVIGSVGLAPISSEEILWFWEIVTEALRRVIVLSGVPALFDNVLAGEAFASREARGAACLLRFMALSRCDSLLFAAFSTSLLSLLITSAKALPNECRKLDDLVAGLFRGALAPVSEDIISRKSMIQMRENVQVVREIKGRVTIGAWFRVS